MKIISNYQYQFTEEEQRALVLVHEILYKLLDTTSDDTDEEKQYFNAFCVVDGLCEDIPSRIWNPDENEERYNEE